MSPSWRDRVELELGGASLGLRRRAAGWRARYSSRMEAALEIGATPGLAPALALLDAALTRVQWRRAELAAVVSDHWVRYVALPWSPGLDTPAERELLARELLVAHYGSAVANWTLSLTPLSAQLTQVAAALDPAVADGLGEVCARHGMNLVSLRPRHVAEHARHCARLPAAEHWFVSVEPGLLCATHLVAGAWRQVRSLRIGERWGGELKRLCLLDGGAAAQATPIYVSAPPALRDGGAGLTVEWLDDSAAPRRSLA